jgi:D-alanyl-D-alanine carboxypeptidase
VQLISVVLGAPSEAERDSESLAMLDYGFGLYRVRHPVRAKETLASPSIRYSGGELALRAAHPITAGVRRGERLRTSVRAPGEVTGPIGKGKRLGRVAVTVDGRPAGAAALVATRAVPEASEFDKLRSHALLVLALIALGGSAILVAAFAIRRRMRRVHVSEEDMEEGREQRRMMREQRRNDREGSHR